MVFEVRHGSENNVEMYSTHYVWRGGFDWIRGFMGENTLTHRREWPSDQHDISSRLGL